MTDIAVDGMKPKTLPDYPRIGRVFALLFALGWLSLAAAADRQAPRSCHEFTIGISAIGGCDWIGGPPTIGINR